MSKSEFIKHHSNFRVLLHLILFIVGSQLMSETFAFQVKKDTLDYWNVQKFVINQKTSQEQLDEMKSRLKKENVMIDFTNITRNENNGYLKGLKIDYKSDRSKGEYLLEPQQAFTPIAIQYDVVGKTVSIGPNPTSNLSQTIQLEPKRVGIDKEKDTLNDMKDGLYIPNKPKDHMLKKSDTIIKKNVASAGSVKTFDTLTVRAEAEDDSVYLDSDSQVYVIKKVDGKLVLNDSMVNKSRGNLKWISEDGTEESIIALDSGNEILFSNTTEKPLMVLDGEIYKQDLKLIDQKKIKSIQVLKGDKALSKYGDDGKNGVIEINMKKKNVSSNYDYNVEVDDQEIVGGPSSPDGKGTVEFMTLTINKNSDRDNLEKQKEYLKKINVEVEYSKIQRDEADYITRIRITLKDANGNTASSIFNGTYGIKQIYFGKDKKGLFISDTR